MARRWREPFDPRSFPARYCKKWPLLHGREVGSPKKPAGFGIFRQNVDDVICRRQLRQKGFGRDDADAFVAPGGAAHGGDVHVKRGQQLHEPGRDGSVPGDENGLPLETSAPVAQGHPRLAAVGEMGASDCGRSRAWASMNEKTCSAQAWS